MHLSLQRSVPESRFSSTIYLLMDENRPKTRFSRENWESSSVEYASFSNDPLLSLPWSLETMSSWDGTEAFTKIILSQSR